jgi:hypothetical protein
MGMRSLEEEVSGMGRPFMIYWTLTMTTLLKKISVSFRKLFPD